MCVLPSNRSIRSDVILSTESGQTRSAPSPRRLHTDRRLHSSSACRLLHFVVPPRIRGAATCGSRAPDPCPRDSRTVHFHDVRRKQTRACPFRLHGCDARRDTCCGSRLVDRTHGDELSLLQIAVSIEAGLKSLNGLFNSHNRTPSSDGMGGHHPERSCSTASEKVARAPAAT